MCMCVCVCMLGVRYHGGTYGCTMYVCTSYARKRERKSGASGPKGMEKPIPSYQRKWLLADRKERRAFSAEDDNNKRLRSASTKLERGSAFFTIGP